MASARYQRLTSPTLCICRLLLPSVHDCGTHALQLHRARSVHDDGTLQEPAQSHAAEAVEGVALHWRLHGTQHRPQQPVTRRNHPVPQPGHQVLRTNPLLGLQMYTAHGRVPLCKDSWSSCPFLLSKTQVGSCSIAKQISTELPTLSRAFLTSAFALH